MSKTATHDDFLSEIQSSLEAIDHQAELYEAVVNLPFQNKLITGRLGLGIVVLLLFNNKTNEIDRVALSKTDMAQGAVNYSAKPFKAIKIPADDPNNIIAATIRTDEPHSTDDWQYLFVPSLSPQEARFNQAGAGVGCSCVYPIKARDGGAMIFSYYLELNQIGDEQRSFMQQYIDIVARALNRV